MKRITITRGLDVPITGHPMQRIDDARPVSRVALVGPDYVGMRPTMAVGVGDRVRLGQLLFEDKKTPGVRHTSPGSGTIVEINRGEKRAFLSIVIELEGDEAETFSRYAQSQLETLTVDQVKENLITSGLWTALRTRPFSRVPAPETLPESLFVTAMDTNPLAARPELILAERPQDFVAGLQALARLAENKVFLCKAPQTEIPGVELPGATPVEFAGPHPAGLPGTHIHFLDPVGVGKTVWYVNYQDVMAVGSLFLTGMLDNSRVVSLAGPVVKQPRLLRTRLGANVAELTEGELEDGENRVVSGPVISGRKAGGPLAYLGRYDLQISALAEARRRAFFGWLMPGWRKYSVKRVNASSLTPGREFALTTTTSGSRRAIVPIGSYEKVMPLDLLPTFLLRALEVGDIEQADALGCLELDEDDLALCTFVCPGKENWGQRLREILTTIQKEG